MLEGQEIGGDNGD